MTCDHKETRELTTRCYDGPVVVHDQNPAAHGDITVEVECARCGARRSENLNGCHAEEGPWGPSRAERQAHADRLRRALPATPSPCTFRSGDKVATVVCLGDGTMTVRGGPAYLVDQYPRLEQAVALRRAWLEFEEAERAV